MTSPNAELRERRVRGAVGATAPWAFGVVLVLVWYAGVWLSGVPAFLLPTPDAVARRLLEVLTDASFWGYAGTTLFAALGGCVAGAAVALPLAVLIHRNRWVSAALVPYLGATQAIPAIAIAPLLVLWVGYGFSAVIFLCALLVFFPILVSAVVGLRHVEGPMALPNVLAGFRNGFSLSVTGAVVGEMVMGGQGLGTLLTVQRDSLDTAGMFATIAVLAAMASLAYTGIHLVERRSRVMQSLSG